MADRVAVICGSTPGRDHFPFSVRDLSQDMSMDEQWWGRAITPGSGFVYPVGLSLDQVMKWYWRVKTWRVSIVASFTADANDGIQPPYSVNYSGTFDIPMAPFTSSLTEDREANLASAYFYDPAFYTGLAEPRLGPLSAVSSLRPFTGPSPTGTTTAPDGVATFQLVDLLLFSLAAAPTELTSVIYDGGVFYPLLILVAELDVVWSYTYDEGGPDEGEESFSIGSTLFTLEQEGGDPSLGTATIDGQTIATFGTGDSPNLYDQAWSVSMNPIEFWPYATRAGLPVYDTATGAQLRDPFS